MIINKRYSKALQITKIRQYHVFIRISNTELHAILFSNFENHHIRKKEEIKFKDIFRYISCVFNKKKTGLVDALNKHNMKQIILAKHFHPYGPNKVTITQKNEVILIIPPINIITKKFQLHFMQ